MPPLENSIALALRAHRGQVDKAGQPYILHLLRVMLSVKSNTERTIAILHDLLEDTGFTLADLKKLGYSKKVQKAIDALTKRQGESYEDFIKRVQNNPTAARVKIADLRDNLNGNRLKTIDSKTVARMRKYRKALRTLENSPKSR